MGLARKPYFCAVNHIMRTRCLLSVLVLLLVASSCKEDVDFYADYKVIPAIYALFDADADTNFVKITKVFATEGDPTVIAQDPNEAYYPEKLDVRLVEYRNGVWTREILLDTVTKPKQEGVFAGPSQLLYYTDEKLMKNLPDASYSYELQVFIDRRIIATFVDMVSSVDFDVLSPHLNFSQEYFGSTRHLRFTPAINAAFYDVQVLFHYKEQRTPSGDTTEVVFSFIHNRYMASDLAHTLDEDGYYSVSYRPEEFYTGLGSFLGDDTLNILVQRYIPDYPLEVRVEAGGIDMLNYLQCYDPNLANSQVMPDVQCVGEGATGLVSSRCRVYEFGRLAGQTVPQLTKKKWNFKYIGGS